MDQLLSFSTAQALSTTASQQAGLSKAQISALEAAGATIYGTGMYWAHFRCLSVSSVHINILLLIFLKLFRGKGDGPYRGFGYLGLFMTLEVWQHGAKANYCNFASFNRVIDTKTSKIQMGPTWYVKTLVRKWISTDNNFLISQNTLADLKGPKGNIICTVWMMYRETFTAATRHNTSCSNRK